jgi:hypothetical protein
MELDRERLHPNAAFLFCILVDSYDIPGCYMIFCPTQLSVYKPL